MRRVNLLLLVLAPASNVNGKSHKIHFKEGPAINACFIQWVASAICSQTLLAPTSRNCSTTRRVCSPSPPKPDIINDVVLGRTNIWARPETFSWSRKYSNRFILYVDCRARIMWVKRPIVDAKKRFFKNARCSCGKDMRTGLFSCLLCAPILNPPRWFNVYLPSVGLEEVFFMILQSKFEQKEIEAPRRRRRKRNWKLFCANRRQVKSKMLHLRRLCFRFAFFSLLRLSFSLMIEPTFLMHFQASPKLWIRNSLQWNERKTFFKSSSFRSCRLHRNTQKHLLNQRTFRSSSEHFRVSPNDANLLTTTRAEKKLSRNNFSLSLSSPLSVWFGFNLLEFV